MNCPKCNHECEADFVDNGVGDERCGPWFCNPDTGGCGWVEDAIEELMINLFDSPKGKIYNNENIR